MGNTYRKNKEIWTDITMVDYEAMVDCYGRLKIFYTGIQRRIIVL